MEAPHLERLIVRLSICREADVTAKAYALAGADMTHATPPIAKSPVATLGRRLRSAPFFSLVANSALSDSPESIAHCLYTLFGVVLDAIPKPTLGFFAKRALSGSQ
jgi:hypothetical protein